ncbi:ROK family protein [Sphingomonas sp.]|uniref:ROK family protein n=1 Tax=Sphingomonas sp. TaxID=28214 RepID=UPI0025F9CF11|nr:ROK family protein [Sphingomonas sp.]
MTTKGPLFAGVELGGTKCICTLGHGPDGIIDQLSLPTGDSEDTLATIARQIERWYRGPGFDALGIGSFGPLNLNPLHPEFGSIQQTSKPGWSGAAVLRRIAAGIDRPVRIDTDVNAAAAAERRWGAGRDTRQFAYVTVGTGVGVGFASGDAGAREHHAELGHVRAVRQVDDRHPSVCPYHTDCVEGLASGKAIVARFAGVIPEDIALNDPRWAAPIDYLGQLCHALMCHTVADRIAFGGGVVMGNPGLAPAIERAMRASLNGYLTLDAQPILVEALLGAQAGPLGTLALAQDARADAATPAQPSPRRRAAGGATRS